MGSVCMPLLCIFLFSLRPIVCLVFRGRVPLCVSLVRELASHLLCCLPDSRPLRPASIPSQHSGISHASASSCATCYSPTLSWLERARSC